MRYEYYAIVAAFCFGLNSVLVRKALKDTTPATATLTVAAVQVTILSVLLAFDLPEINWTAVFLFALAGLFAAVLGRTLNYIGIDRLGVSVSTSLTNTNPIFSLILAVIFLGEPLSITTILGSLLVVAGVAFISGVGTENKINPKDLVIPLSSAFFYAASSIVRKMGLNILPESILGAVVGALAGLITYPIILRLMGRGSEFQINRASAPWLIGGGLATTMAWITMFTATQQGNVSVVSAVIGANPLFSLILAALLLKDTEKITGRVVVGCLLIVSAVALITLF